MKLQSGIRGLLIALVALSLSGCASTGQQFRDILADIDAQCKEDHKGPYLDPKDFEYPRKRTDASCDILTIKPVDPMASEEGRFTYSLKLPGSHDKLQAQYSRWMSAESYFKELCEKDAGEWIFRKVEGVDGVFQGRQDISKEYYSNLLFQIYETNEVLTSDMQDLLVQPYHGRYNYMERPRDPEEIGMRYVRFFRGQEVPGHYKYGTQKNGMTVEVPYIVNKEQTDKLRSRYGFTWRQISTSDMLENGITGGETIIYDRATGEVLAFRRFFYRYWPTSDSKYTRLAEGNSCHHPNFPKAPSEFIQSVLVPINPDEFSAK